MSVSCKSYSSRLKQNKGLKYSTLCVTNLKYTNVPRFEWNYGGKNELFPRYCTCILLPYIQMSAKVCTPMAFELSVCNLYIKSALVCRRTRQWITSGRIITDTSRSRNISKRETTEDNREMHSCLFLHWLYLWLPIMTRKTNPLSTC